MGSGPRILEGWCAIRRYLAEQGVRRSTTTLKRYRSEKGLPVNSNDVTNIVSALPEDLDDWIMRALIGKE